MTAQDQIAPGAVFVTASDGGTEAGGVVTWDLGTINAGETAVRTVTVDLTVDGSYENISSSNSTTPDANPSNNDGSQPDARVTTVVPLIAADLVTTKTGLTSGAPGQYLYTIATTNLGPSAAENVTVQDQIAPGATFAGASEGGTEAGGVVTWNLGTVTPGQTVVRTVTVDLSTAGSYENIATSDSTTTDADPSNNDGSQPTARVTTVVPAATADLVTTKTEIPNGSPGQYTYMLTATNLGPDVAENVTIQDQLAAGAVFVEASEGGSEAGGIVTWDLGTVNPGQTVTRTVTVELNLNGSYENIASGSSTTDDADPSNNDGSQPDARVTTVVLATTDVNLTKTGADSFIPGENITYTLTVENLGAADAVDVRVEDPTPTGLTFVSNTGDCTTPFPCDLGTIPAGESRTITTTFAVPADYSGSDPIVNAATVAATNDTDPANNTAQASVPSVSGPPNLRLVKRITAVRRDGVSLNLANFVSFNDDPTDSNDNAPGWSVLPPIGIPNLSASQPLRSGDEVQYTVYFLSDGATDLTNVSVCDPIPDGTTFLPNGFGAGRGILANQGGVSTPLTNANDSDAGQFFTPLTPVNAPCPQASNPTGAVVFQGLDLAVDEAGFLRFWVELD
ncbi:MAG: DUF11 domain-containing protein [Spirulinaceae cyanobacterium SM2_1_0]|nr:DUF11 domain-containing protein [Spirulinaceae cyanobacterium SM2_1_0]